MKKSNQAGFTLIEILVAITVFAVSILGIVGLRTASLRSVYESERLNQAVALARSKVSEMEIKYQRLINKDGVEATLGEDNGTFDEPWQEFAWKVQVTEPQIKMTPSSMLEFLESMGVDKDLAEEQLESQKLLLTNMNKIIQENFVELRVEVVWTQFGREKSLPVLTHLSPKKIRFNLTTTADSGESGDSK